MEIPDVSGVLHIIKGEIDLNVLAQWAAEMTHREIEMMCGWTGHTICFCFTSW